MRSSKVPSSLSAAGLFARNLWRTGTGRRRKELERRALRLKLLCDTSAELLLHDDPQELLERLFHRVADQLALEVYLHYLVSEDGTHLRLASCTGIPDEVVPGLLRLEFGQAVCGMVAAERTKAAVEDVQAQTTEATALIRSLGITAYACHALVARGRLLGTLSFGTRRRRRFGPEELELMQTLCDQVAAAVERSRLMGELRDVSREAEEARRVAEAANASKDEFLAALSHDLRTPLTPVLLTAQALESDPRLPSELRRNVGLVRRNVELEARLIDDLLDMTRIARGKVRLHRRWTDVHGVLRRSVETCAAQELRPPRIGLDLAGCGRIWADEARLEQVFCNLLSNAVKFTPSDGWIRVRTSEEPPGQLRIEVVDSGAGIDPGVLPRIFDAFEQGGSQVTRRFGGLGLGLAICRSLVEHHGGSITASSAGLGQGATFTVRLPLGPEPDPDGKTDGETEPCAEGLQPSPGLRCPGVRILLVEDHGDTASTMADLLRLQGHRVSVAAGVAEARAAVREAGEESPFDLVVSDLGLPDGSGLDLMRELARDHGLRGIAISGYGMEEDLRKSREAGFAVHLTKPVRREALEAAIRRMTEGE